MECLTDADIAFYRVNGYLTVPDRIAADTLTALRAEVIRFEEEARGMTTSNDRLDLENSHRPDAPRVRRIKRPDLISPVVKDLLRSDAVLAPARDLLGPDIRLHTTKLNMKKRASGRLSNGTRTSPFIPIPTTTCWRSALRWTISGPRTARLWCSQGRTRGRSTIIIRTGCSWGRWICRPAA